MTEFEERMQKQLKNYDVGVRMMDRIERYVDPVSRMELHRLLALLRSGWDRGDTNRMRRAFNWLNEMVQADNTSMLVPYLSYCLLEGLPKRPSEKEITQAEEIEARIQAAEAAEEASLLRHRK